jgi:hypothetical protein
VNAEELFGTVLGVLRSIAKVILQAMLLMWMHRPRKYIQIKSDYTE